MLTAADKIKLNDASLRTNFFKHFNMKVETLFKKITTEIKSNKASENYAWLSEPHGMTEWKDERTPHALIENGFNIKNKIYEETIEVDKTALEDDISGQIMTRVQSMGSAAKTSYDKFLTIVIEENGLCYDGQNFFDTDHEEGVSGSQSNVITSGGKFSPQVIRTIITSMKKFKQSNGKRAGIKPSHVMYPADLDWAAKEMLLPQVVAVTNDPNKAILKGSLELIENDELENNGENSKFYVLDLKSRPTKPFIFQNRKDITFESPKNLFDEFWKNKLYYGTKARFAFGFGDWRQAFRSQG